MRIKRGVAAHKKHKKLLKLNKGYLGSYHKLIKRAKEAYLHAGEYSHQHRMRRASDFRTLWISRINSALNGSELSYSKFIGILKKKDIQLNRKVMAYFALDNKPVFDKIVDEVKH